MRPLLVIAAVSAIAACAPDLRVDFPFDGQTGDGGPKFVVQFSDDAGVRDAVVDAFADGSRVYVDLDHDRELSAQEAFDTNGWDLGFARYHITSNSGPSTENKGKVEVAILPGADFDLLQEAPATGYEVDGVASVFNKSEELSVLTDKNNPDTWCWYRVLGEKHSIVPKAIVYVVKSSDGRYFKLQMLGYYDASGTSGHPAFRYQAIASP